MRLRLACVACGLTLLSACGGDDPARPAEEREARTAPATMMSEASEASAASGTRIVARTSEFGTVLWGPKRQAIYIFERDGKDRSRCYGDCAEAWPPVLTTGNPVADGEVDATKLGTTKRKDGRLQVTYNGRPLYYYDEPAGEVSCHNVDEFGGLWLVVEASGEAVG